MDEDTFGDTENALPAGATETDGLRAPLRGFGPPTRTPFAVSSRTHSHTRRDQPRRWRREAPPPRALLAGRRRQDG